ncbi:TonB family protein [Sphingomonas sp. BN140010]|uniref:TonB family protein n=1 Tax=Sphingomonas arvum TaxID=2992113 RepID=A0ABT3JBX3_9SPHN|nr:TonB family protein [Sphingomonas sp. BN140010]MCW3796567.1 TonB family protein [Sphingomonas sp. BN140010]
MATRAPLLNYYEVLGVPRTAGPGDIEAAYRAGVVRFRDQPGGGEQTRRISLAYRALSNPERRREYDASLGYPPREEPAAAMPLDEEPPVSTSAEEPPPAVPADEPPPAAPAYERMDRRAEREPAFPVRDDPVAPDDDYYPEDEPDERRGRGGLIAVWAVALGLVALLALYASGMIGGREPQVATRNGAPVATGPHAGTGTGPAAPGQLGAGAPVDGTQLADAGRSPTVDGVQSTVPTPVGQAGSASVSGYYPAAPSAQNDAAVGDDAASAAGADEPAAAAEDDGDREEEVAPPPLPTRQNQPEPVAAPVAQAPAPAPDRSAQARLLGGGLVNADNVGGRFQGTVGVRLAVGPNGRATGCQVTRSSGNGGLDATTCRLLQQRLQFSPARDRDGNPTTTVVESTHVWGRRPRR